MEFGSENFVNLYRSFQIAIPRTVRGLAVDILWAMNTHAIIAATGQALCEVSDKTALPLPHVQSKITPSMIPLLPHIIRNCGHCKSPVTTGVAAVF